MNPEEHITYLENIIALMPGNVYWKDRAGKYQGCNQGIMDIIGLNNYQEIIGKTLYDFFDRELADSITQIDEQIMCSGKEMNLEEEGVDKEGNRAFYLTRKLPLKDKQGQIIGLLGMSMDITERKLLELELLKTKDELEIANHNLKILSASIAHELRTPLTAIKSGMSGLKKFLPSLLISYKLAKDKNINIPFIPKFQLKFLKNTAEYLINEVNDSHMMINLLLAKLNGKSKDLLMLSMNACISKALERYTFLENEKKLIKWVAENDFIFFGEELLTIHVIFNLIKNALHAIRETGKGEIIIWLESEVKYNKLYFKDTAKGIAEEALPYIFEYFYSKSYGGTGIGLAYSKKVIEDIGGIITCSSVEQEYCLFTIYFPKIENYYSY